MLHLSLRKYQHEALSSVVRSFDNSIHRQLLVLPTGAGKTCLFIAIFCPFFGNIYKLILKNNTQHNGLQSNQCKHRVFKDKK